MPVLHPHDPTTATAEIARLRALDDRYTVRVQALLAQELEIEAQAEAAEAAERASRS